MRTMTNGTAKTRLLAELSAVARRLRSDSTRSAAGGPAGNFLDLAQGVESSEQAGLTVSRLVERANRLRRALTRVSDGRYGCCAECDRPIPQRRLLALPDVTTCVACQEQLERRASMPVAS